MAEETPQDQQQPPVGDAQNGQQQDDDESMAGRTTPPPVPAMRRSRHNAVAHFQFCEMENFNPTQRGIAQRLHTYMNEHDDYQLPLLVYAIADSLEAMAVRVHSLLPHMHALHYHPSAQIRCAHVLRVYVSTHHIHAHRRRRLSRTTTRCL